MRREDEAWCTLLCALDKANSLKQTSRCIGSRWRCRDRPERVDQCHRLLSFLAAPDFKGLQHSTLSEFMPAGARCCTNGDSSVANCTVSVQARGRYRVTIVPPHSMTAQPPVGSFEYAQRVPCAESNRGSCTIWRALAKQYTGVPADAMVAHWYMLQMNWCPSSRQWPPS